MIHDKDVLADFDKASRTIRNYVGRIMDHCETLKKQPPQQRYGTADSIAHLARAIRDEVARVEALRANTG